MGEEHSAHHVACERSDKFESNQGVIVCPHPVCVFVCVCECFVCVMCGSVCVSDVHLTREAAYVRVLMLVQKGKDQAACSGSEEYNWK